MKDDTCFITLIKPQFEAGREQVGKKGVVRDPSIHIEVITDLVSFFHQQGLAIRGLTYSPIKGPEGNIEYLLHLKKDEEEESGQKIDPEQVVREAHETLA